MQLRENVLLHLDNATLDRIFASRSGAERMRQLFRLVQGRIIGRGVVATVAQQDDYMRRVRRNGGARDLLPEGIVVLGQYESHRRIAHELGLPVPGPGESVSARLIPVDAGESRPNVELGGHYWAVALPGDSAHVAPAIPYT